MQKYKNHRLVEVKKSIFQDVILRLPYNCEFRSELSNEVDTYFIGDVPIFQVCRYGFTPTVWVLGCLLIGI